MQTTKISSEYKAFKTLTSRNCPAEFKEFYSAQESAKAGGKIAPALSGTTLKTVPVKSTSKAAGDSFTKHISFGDFRENSQSNIFLKEYIEKKALKAGVFPLEDFEIAITSPIEYSKEFKQLTSDISRNIFGARVKDMFDFFEKDDEEFSNLLEKMDITSEQKEQMLEFKNCFDNYYKIEGIYKGKRFDLLNPDDEDIQELSELCPAFKDFILEEQQNLQDICQDFTRKEIQSLRLNEAGYSSRMMALVLLPVLLFIVGLGIYRSKKDFSEMQKDMAGFIQKQKEIYSEGKPKLQNPIKAFRDNAAAEGGTVALLGTTLAGSWDDLMGCVKDYKQDQDNFGTKTALKINIPAAVLGVLSSAAIAPMIEDEIKYNKAVSYLKKYEPSAVKTGGKLVFGAALGAFVINALKGILITTSSSGSSWGSVIGTRIVLGHNGKKMQEKNIISKEQNTVKNTYRNMLAYEAYDGKLKGITLTNGLFGIIGGGSGLFTHYNPIVQAASFGLQGCSETVTACLYQITGKQVRKDKLEVEKKKLVENA